MKKIFFIDDGFYHTASTVDDMKNILHDKSPYIQHIGYSYLNQTEFDKALVFVSEVRYPYQESLDQFEHMVEIHNVNRDNAIFIVVTCYEPRPAIYSYWVKYLMQKHNIQSESITYINNAECKYDLNLPIRIISSPILGVNFTKNYDSMASFRPDHLYELYTNKTKLFSSLVRRLNVSRVLMTSSLMANFEKSDYELSVGQMLPKEMTKFQQQFYNRISASIGGDIDFVEKQPIRFDKVELDVQDHKGRQYVMMDPLLRNCLFDVVYETVGGNDIFLEESVKMTDNFFSCTEKSFRHIFNFQIPIFFCGKGFYEFFYRTFKLKPFDIIPWEYWDTIDNSYDKAIEVTKFLKEFKGSDYQKVLTDYKDTFLYNAYRIREVALNSHIQEMKLSLSAINGLWNTDHLQNKIKIASSGGRIKIL